MRQLSPETLEMQDVSMIDDNLRVEDRKSLFVQATLHHVDGCCSVKVRNLSPTGALVEAERLPRSGTPVELRRGSLTAMGTVIWKRAGKAGVEFLNQTDPKLWLPSGTGAGAIDNAFQVFKGVPAPVFKAPEPSAAITTEDVEAVAAMLDDLSATFAGDAGISYNYAAKLQALEIASQMLRKLAGQARDRRRR